MSALQIITAEERLAERRGAKILLTGSVGVGKTSQLRTLDPARTLFIDVEAGDLAVADAPVPTIRIDDWPTLRTSSAVSAALTHPSLRQLATPTPIMRPLPALFLI